MNRNDPPGTAMAVIVWILIGMYSVFICAMIQPARFSYTKYYLFF